MNPTVSPQSIEQTTLAALAAQKEPIVAYLNSCPLGAPASTMAPWIAGLDPFAWSLQQRTPIAVWLSRQDLPHAEQCLHTLLQDLATARQTYLDMYRGMLSTEEQCRALWQEAADVTTHNTLSATRYAAAVFARWQESYFDLTEERCFACHQPLGIVGGGYHFGCARRLGLI